MEKGVIRQVEELRQRASELRWEAQQRSHLADILLSEADHLELRADELKQDGVTAAPSKAVRQQP